MGVKMLSVLGHYQVSAENAGKIIDGLGLSNDYTDEEMATALEWAVDNCLNKNVCNFNPYHELPSVLRTLKLMLMVVVEDLDFFLEAHGLNSLPKIESVDAEKIRKLILCILEKQYAIELIRDSFPLD